MADAGGASRTNSGGAGRTNSGGAGRTNSGGAGRTHSGVLKRSTSSTRGKAHAAHEFFSLEAVDFGQLKDEVSANPIEEDHLIMEAIQLAQQRKFDTARDLAESVLHSNPNNTTAIQVNASECESRQDWGMAAKCFLSGMNHNVVDGAMEHGFNTNVDLLRASRPRWLERGPQNKWDDVLSFKPRPQKEREGTPEEKPPWWRLGKRYEEIVSDPGYVNDLIETAPDPEDEREELRRVIWENYLFLDVLYAYYATDMNETWDFSQPIPGMISHTGDEEEMEGESQIMRMPGFWRILKECKLAYGDVKVKMHLAVFDRVHFQGQQRTTSLMREDPNYSLASEDPHHRRAEVTFYSFVETLIRAAYLKMVQSGSVSGRLDALFSEYIRPFALKKQTNRNFLDFSNRGVQASLTDPATEPRLRKVFDYFISSYKQNKARSNATGQYDITMTMNHVLVMMEKCNLFDPNYNVKKCAEAYGAIICDTDLLPQEHPNNQNSEMIFWEFLEFLVRTAKLKASGSKEPVDEMVKRWVEGEFIPSCARVIPGKI